MPSFDSIESHAATAEDSFAALIQDCAVRVQGLLEEGDRKLEELALLEGLLESVRTGAAASAARAGEALDTLRQRLGQVQSDTAAALQRVAASHEEAQARSDRAVASEAAAHAELLAAEDRLREIQDGCVPLAAQAVQQAQDLLAGFCTAAEATSGAVQAASQELEVLCRGVEEGLGRARAALADSGERNSRSAVALRDELSDCLKHLHAELEAARDRTRGDVQAALARLQSLGAERDEVVSRHLAQELALEVSRVSEELGGALAGLRPLPRAPRRLADTELFGSTRRLRDTFEPLAEVDRVWRRARALGRE